MRRTSRGSRVFEWWALYTGIVSNLGLPAAASGRTCRRREGGCGWGRKPSWQGSASRRRFAPRSRLSLGITTYDGELSITGKAWPLTIGAEGLERFLEHLGAQLRERLEPQAEPAKMRA